MNSKKLFSGMIILILMCGFILSFTPIAHATSPSVTTQTNGNSVNDYTGTATAAFTPTAGDVIVFAASVLNSPTTGMATPTDSQGNTYVLASDANILLSGGTGCLSSGGAYQCDSVIYITTASQSVSMTITSKLAGTSCNLGGCTILWEVLEITNVGATVTCTDVGNSASGAGTAIQAAALYPCAIPTNSIAIGEITGAASGSMAAGTSFTGYCENTCNVASGSMIEWTTTLTSTTCPATNGVSSQWTDACIVLAAGTSSISQVQTIGACTPTATGGTYLTNATQYWYGGNSLGQEAVSTIQTQVENIKGSGSHTLQLLIYTTVGNPAAQSPSGSYPATLAYSQSFVITSGTTNSTITVNVNIPLNTASTSPLPFNYWAVGIVGDDHIRIHNSATSGMTTQTGAASTASQPSKFTSSGASTSTKLQLCAKGTYQSVLSVVSTTTAGGTTTSTVLVTTTSTINTIGPSLFSTESNWPVIFLILLLPAGLFLGVTKTLAGALLGLMVGAVIGLMMGILPSFVFIGVVISLAAIAFIARERSG